MNPTRREAQVGISFPEAHGVLLQLRPMDPVAPIVRSLCHQALSVAQCGLGVHLSPFDSYCNVDVFFQYLKSTVLPERKGILTEPLVPSQLCCSVLVAAHTNPMQCFPPSVTLNLQLNLVTQPSSPLIMVISICRLS